MTESTAQVFAAEQRFLRRAAIALVTIAVLGFANFTLLGISDLGTAPTATLVHGALMIAWLALFITQVILGTKGSLALHRKLGWIGALLVVVVAITSVQAQLATFTAGRVPPFFPPGYFLMLGLTNIVLFTLCIAAAITKRKQTDWHKRLMIGSLVLIYEPVLGRVLPFSVFPFLGGPETAIPVLLENRWSLEAYRAVVHLGIVGLLMWRDKAINGRVHPAFYWILGAVAFSYSVINTVGFSQPVIELAQSMMPNV